tara:strand:+ start:14182 stop:15408 length:1227 start_codon:yes stop_codon:yes gene_type:complete
MDTITQENKIEEVRVRKWIRKILQDQKYGTLSESWGPVYSPQESYRMFIEPFADIFSAAKIAFVDVLSSAKLNLDVFLSISPKSFKAAEDAWRSRNAEITSKYKALMEKIDKDSGADAQLFTFMLNPAGYLGYRMVKSGISAEGVPGVLKDAGFSVPGLAAIGLGTAATSGGSEKSSGSDGPVTGLLKSLKGLFFLPEHSLASGRVIYEDAEEKQGGSGVAEVVQAHLEELGILDEINEDAERLIKSKAEIIKELISEVKSRSDVMTPIYTAESVEEFKKALNAAKTSGIEIGDIAGIENALEKSINDAMSNPKVKAGLVDKASDGKDNASIDEDKLRADIEKTIFMNSVQPLREKISELMNKLIDDVKKAINQDMPSESSIKMIEQTPAGKSLLSLVKKANQALNSV